MDTVRKLDKRRLERIDHPELFRIDGAKLCLTKENLSFYDVGNKIKYSVPLLKKKMLVRSVWGYMKDTYWDIDFITDEHDHNKILK